MGGLQFETSLGKKVRQIPSQQNKLGMEAFIPRNMGGRGRRIFFQCLPG
jgi:hypothetical protein